MAVGSSSNDKSWSNTIEYHWITYESFGWYLFNRKYGISDGKLTNIEAKLAYTP